MAAFVLVLVLIMLIIVGLHIWALIDSVVRPDWVYERAGSSKIMWILLNVLLGFPCGLIYLFAIRPRLQRAEALGPVSWAMRPPQPGWYPDPARRHDVRYWNGWSWTESVSSGGHVSSDPLGYT
ncbi:MAG TPA: DUF2510 domain-containing protein [Acidimicrobiales bacterium]|jgi:hypothetical protein|nr:DUF2510 domain-containing protein [Acidimicrobiales bacterium]